MTMEQPVEEVVDISLAVGEVVVGAAAVVMMADEEETLERYC